MAEIDLTPFYGQFRDEAWENLTILEQGMTALESSPGDTALLDRMLRAIHTTKGSAKIMGFGDINRLAHTIEDILGAVRKGSLVLTSEMGSAILEASGGIRTLVLNRLENRDEPVDVAGLMATMQRAMGEEVPGSAPFPHPAPVPQAEPAPPAPAPQPEPTPAAQAQPAPPTEPAAPVVTVSAPTPSRPRETMRVDMEQIDRLARLVSEVATLHEQAKEEHVPIYILSMAHDETTQALRRVREYLEDCRDRFRTRQAEEMFQRLAMLENTIQQMQQQWDDFTRDHAALLERQTLALGELQQQTLTVRMVPIGTLFEIFPGVVRRMAGESGVEVALEVRGVEVEMDRRVLDQLREPLVHLVRNALAHGIEPPEERLRQGKDRRGQVILGANALGQRVQIRIEDDGRGVDLAKVRRTAVERGLISEERAAEANEQALIDLLFRPGFTTARQADDMSGRGVGLDVVMTTLRQLNGMVQVQTGLGRGTTFILDVPLTMATVRVLLVETAGCTVAVPTAAIRSLRRITAEDIVTVEGRPALFWQERPVPLLPLDQALGLPATMRSDVTPALLVGTDGRQVAMTVDQLVDEAEVVVRPLGEILGQTPYFSSATLSGQGQVIPILDLAGLLSARTARVPVSASEIAIAAPDDPPGVLLVEDSMTTRELERSILEAAGYHVETALDGVDALQKLERGRFDIVISDVEMPRMDGIELTMQIHQDGRWNGLPVVIVSGREDEESRRRGLQAGAQAYIVKSRFDQSNLLGTIAQLIG